MNTRRASLLLCLASCATSLDETASAVTTPDREMLQALITKAGPGGDVFFPAGNFIVGPPGSSPYCLTAASVHIHGAGQGVTNITLAETAGSSARIFNLTGTDSSVDNMTLDGNKAHQTPSEQSHGIFAQEGSRLRISRVTAQNFPGDGFYVSHGVSDIAISDSTSQNNDRHGITMGSTVTGITISGNHISGNAWLQIDSEPKGTDVVTNVTVANNTLVAPALGPGRPAMSVGGQSSDNSGSQWTVTNNTITGGILVIWVNNVVIADNHITSPADLPPVEVQRSSSNVTITRNTLAQTSAQLNTSGVYIDGTTVDNMPSNIHVTDNQISVANTTAFGVRATGAIDVTVAGNTITGPAGTSDSYAGVVCRSTIAGRHFQLCAVTDNTINGFARGVNVSGDKAMGWMVDELDVARNTINSRHGVGPDSANNTPGALFVMGNTWGPNVALPHIGQVSSATRIIASDEPITVVPATP